MKPAFSTVAFPDWPLDSVAEFAAEAGAAGVELRTFGHESAQSACDPMWTDTAKTRRLFNRAGCDIASVATSIRFDEAIRPAVLGRLTFDIERPVRETKRAVRLAAELGAPFVRVFGFELQPDEPRARGLRRIMERLELAVATARNTGVRIVIENGDSFPTAVDLAELLDLADTSLVGASYCAATARAAGEAPEAGVNVLGDRLQLVKLRDFHRGRPCTLGDGEFGVRDTVKALASGGYVGHLVYEYDHVWLRGAFPGVLPPPGDIVRASVRAMYDMLTSAASMRHEPSTTAVR